ncbi:iron chaperone [Halobacillus seohaensis]|uniref:Iron chaperone n=1 Tax=Halobacillus seohaensis TaxID=447421 RepID=A0ABW2EPL2_9BACI
MEVFSKYLAGIDNPDHRDRTEEVLSWVANKFPNLEPQIKWNTPMFTDHGTFIIGIDTAKNHMSLAPEEVAMAHFSDGIAQAGYSATKGLFRIKWSEPVNYELIEEIIEFNIQDKAECSTFWRK